MLLENQNLRNCLMQMHTRLIRKPNSTEHASPIRISMKEIKFYTFIVFIICFRLYREIE